MIESDQQNLHREVVCAARLALRAAARCPTKATRKAAIRCRANLSLLVVVLPSGRDSQGKLPECRWKLEQPPVMLLQSKTEHQPR